MIILEQVATNVFAGQLPDRQATGMPTARAKNVAEYFEDMRPSFQTSLFLTQILLFRRQLVFDWNNILLGPKIKPLGLARL